MSYHLGIDVGTTFISAAIATAGKAQMITLGDRAVMAPAAVYGRDGGTLATGEAAGLPAGSGPDQVCKELISRLGDPTPVVLGNQPYAITTVLGVLLHDVVQKVIEIQGQAPDHIALTRPASWGPYRCTLLEEAARQAGMTTPALVTEPEAAAAHYAASRGWNDGETIAVYDLGGGTFNATVLRKQSGDAQILGKPERIERLGGEDFDEAILSYVNDTTDGVLTQLDTRHPQTNVALAGVRQACIAAKETLSASTTTTVPVLLPSQRFEVRLARPEFEEMVQGLISSTIRALHRTLRSAQVAPADLSAVLLVGGSSHIPLVAQMVSAELGCPAVVDSRPQYAVALGAALLAAQTTKEHATTSATPALRIPAQRAPLDDAIPTGFPAVRGSTAALNRGVMTVPVVKPPPKPSPPPLQRPVTPHRHGRPKGGRPASPDRGLQPRVLIGAGAAVALIGTIMLAILGGMTDTPPSASSARTPPSQPAPAAVAKLSPGPALPALVATIPVSRSPAFVVVSPDGTRAYAANRDARNVTIMDTALNHVIGTIPIAAGPPQFLAVAPNGRTLYVSVFNDERTIHEIDVLDMGSNAVVATIPQPARPYLPALTPDGTRLYVPNHDIAAVSVIDTAANTVIGQISVAPNPHWVAFSPDGSRAYTANHESNLVSVIDTATRTVLATVPVGTSPHSVAVNPHRPLAANVNFDSHSVSEIETTTNKVVATIPVGTNPQDIAWSPDGRFAYVVNQGSNTISVIDANTNQVTTTLPTGTGPTSVALLPNGHRAFVSNLDSGTVTVFDLPT